MGYPQKGKLNMSRPVVRLLALAAVCTATQAVGFGQRGITQGSCGANYPSAWVGPCNWSSYAFFANIKFYANATCTGPCYRQGISTNLILNIGQNNGPCTYQVNFNFEAGSVGSTPSNPVPYVTIVLEASSTLGWASAYSKLTCNNVPSGYSSFPQQFCG
jgi:hypothetical protein